MDIDKDLAEVVFPIDRIHEILGNLLGLDDFDTQKVYALRLLMQKEMPYKRIIEMASCGVTDRTRTIFRAAAARDPMRADFLCEKLHVFLEENLEDRSIGLRRNDLCASALIGFTLGIFEVGTELKLHGIITPTYRTTIKLPILSLVKMRNSATLEMESNIWNDSVASKLSSAIKAYYRAGDGSSIAEAKNILDDIVALLAMLPNNKPGSKLGELIVSQVAFAVFSPMSPYAQAKSVSDFMNNMLAFKSMSDETLTD